MRRVRAVSELGRAAEELLAVAGELVDPEVVEAAGRLRDVAVEADALDRRFHAAAAELYRLLEARSAGVVS